MDIELDQELNDKKREDAVEKPPNYFNSWEYVRDIRSRIYEDEYPVLASLEAIWRQLAPEYREIYGVDREEDEGSGGTPMSAFMRYIEKGCYPPPEILLAIYDCFNEYLRQGGLLEIEDVFFGPRKRGTGNRASRESKTWLYRHFYVMDLVGFSTTEKKSQVQLAEELFEKFGIDDRDIDGFLRSYRRWRKANKGLDPLKLLMG